VKVLLDQVCPVTDQLFGESAAAAAAFGGRQVLIRWQQGLV